MATEQALLDQCYCTLSALHSLSAEYSEQTSFFLIPFPAHNTSLPTLEGIAQFYQLRNGGAKNPYLTVTIFQRSCLCLRMASYGGIGNTSPLGGESDNSDEERDSVRTPLVLPKGRRGMHRQPASQVDTHLQEC